MHLSGRAVEKRITSVLAELDIGPDDADYHRGVRAVLLYLSDSASD